MDDFLGKLHYFQVITSVMLLFHVLKISVSRGMSLDQKDTNSYFYVSILVS